MYILIFLSIKYFVKWFDAKKIMEAIAYFPKVIG